MIKKNLAIIGAGGFGRELFYLLDSNIYECVGFLEIKSSKLELPAPIIGSEGEIYKIMKEYIISCFAIAIGDTNKRKTIIGSLKKYSLFFPAITHKSAQVFTNHIGHGSVIYPNVVIMHNCVIGKYSLINSGVTIGHDVIVGEYCNIHSGVNLAGGIVIGECTFIGIGSTIKENITIGKNSIIGAGSVVLNNVPDNTMVYGVPARVVSEL